MLGLKQKNLKKVQSKIAGMIPVITTRHADKKAHIKAGTHMVMGIASGVAVGTAAGLLLAPKPGSETRHNIKIKVDKIGKTTKERADEAIGTVKGVVSKAKEKRIS